MMSSPFTILESEATEDEPKIYDLAGWGATDRIIIMWEMESGSEQVTGFEIYRELYADDNHYFDDIEYNASYEPYRVLGPNARYYVDQMNLDAHFKQKYVYKVVPLIEGNKSKGRSTYAETIYGDADNDGISDWYESLVGLDAYNFSDGAIDSDGDKFTNLIEYLYGTNPFDRNSSPMGGGIYMEGRKDDQDMDGMENDWEVLYDLNPRDSSDAFKDKDQDGITNLQEFLDDTRPDIPKEVVIPIEEDEEKENEDLWILFMVFLLFMMIDMFQPQYFC